jgi:hypothetical protein
MIPNKDNDLPQKFVEDAKGNTTLKMIFGVMPSK